MVHAMNRFSIALLLVALTGVQSCFAQKAASFDKAKLEAYLRYVDLYRGPITLKIDDPKPSKYLPGFSEVTVHLTSGTTSRDDLYYVSADGQTIVSGDVYNMSKSPFQSNLDRLNLEGAPSFGPANAPVTIVEFGDLQCPDCKMEAPVLRQAMPAEFGSKVRVVFKDFPLESIHPWARAAAIAGRCVYRQNKESFWKFYDWMYENQQDIEADTLNPKILKWAADNKLDGTQIGRCIETKATEAEVNKNIAEGRALGVRGTPSLFINGRKIGGLQWQDLQMVLKIELEHVGVK
jgi:protein-disulfide isomerase